MEVHSFHQKSHTAAHSFQTSRVLKAPLNFPHDPPSKLQFLLSVCSVLLTCLLLGHVSLTLVCLYFYWLSLELATGCHHPTSVGTQGLCAVSADYKPAKLFLAFLFILFILHKCNFIYFFLGGFHISVALMTPNTASDKFVINFRA